MGRMTRFVALAVWTTVLAAPLLIFGGTAVAADSPGTLSVVYRTPLVSVEARDAQLDLVLTEVGAQAGFRVMHSGASDRRVTVSIKDATVDDLVRQLLRGENHTLLYRAEAGHPAGVLDEVVLLGPATAGPAVAAAPARSIGTAPAAPATGASPPPGSPVAGLPSAQPAALEPVTELSDDVEPTVSDVLRSHATATLRAAEAARTAAPAPEVAPAPDAGVTPRGRAPSPAQLSPEAQEALATTTRQAQQSLKALVEGLETATQALQQQPAPPPTAPAPR